MGLLDYAKGIGAAILGQAHGATARRSSATDAARRFSYHSGINNRNRDRVTPDERMEDFLYDERREIHVERSRRQLRNFSVLSWMIDKHLSKRTDKIFYTFYLVQASGKNNELCIVANLVFGFYVLFRFLLPTRIFIFQAVADNASVLRCNIFR